MAEKHNKVHPKLFDEAVGYIQDAVVGDAVLSKVFDNVFGIAERTVKMIGGGRFYTPSWYIGGGDYIGKRIDVADDSRSITLKAKERSRGKVYNFEPRAIPLVDALVRCFENGDGWLVAKDLMKKIGKEKSLLFGFLLLPVLYISNRSVRIEKLFCLGCVVKKIISPRFSLNSLVVR